MAKTIKASELEAATKGKIAREVVKALTFLGSPEPPAEIERRALAVLEREDVDDLIRPLFVRPDGEPWIQPAVDPVLQAMMRAGPAAASEESAPAAPAEVELSPEDAPDAPAHPSFRSVPRAPVGYQGTEEDP